MILWEVMIELLGEFAKTGKDISKELVNVAKDAIKPQAAKTAPTDKQSNKPLIIACAAIFLFIALGFLLPHLAPKPQPKQPKPAQVETKAK